MRTKETAQSSAIFSSANGKIPVAFRLPRDYFRVRDFELVQPLYDLAFLLEVDALARESEVPKFRTFSLWRAGYSLDGYGATIDRWLDGEVTSQVLDHVPSIRIKQYLTIIRDTGTLPELSSYRSEQFERCLRLRSIRGLGPSAIAQTLSPDFILDDWLNSAGIVAESVRIRIAELSCGANLGPWQSAHFIPPLVRFLKTAESEVGGPFKVAISGIIDPFEPVTERVMAQLGIPEPDIQQLVERVLERETQFRLARIQPSDGILVAHQMGWSFIVCPCDAKRSMRSLSRFARAFDPLASEQRGDLISDLHLHTSWSDGSASLHSMATAVSASGLEYFAVTDHSRTSKLQGGLTPLLWLRQASALALARPVCPVLHGIEVDILKDGSLDLPNSLLAATDIVVASVHSNWTDDIRTNTARLIKAIESGHVDVIAHPTSTVLGKPGVPDYVRMPAQIDWPQVFDKCALWGVAVELNCFPSRLDLSLPMLRQAVAKGCAISIGSDAHARSHLINLRFGQVALTRVDAPSVLNRLHYGELKDYIASSRKRRRGIAQSSNEPSQTEFSFNRAPVKQSVVLRCQIVPPQQVPSGSRIVGIDLTAGDKPTGVACLDGCQVETCSLSTDEEILNFINDRKPAIVSIDSPLGLPGGKEDIDPAAGIVRVAERDLATLGISAYPALINSMKQLTLRGIRLKKAIEQFAVPPRVIESYPGAAQDILCIPRKQKSLPLLREGLRRLGLFGPGLDTRSHDEMDAITSAVVGRYYEAKQYEPMGIVSEAQLIIPRVRPLLYESNPVISLAGKTGAGKSVVARYLSVFFGFDWIKTRDIIRRLLIEDQASDTFGRLWNHQVEIAAISEQDLGEFGGIVLTVHKQVPLRNALARAIEEIQQPIVVDSVRDIVDITPELRSRRPVITWFIDSNDSVIEQRLATRPAWGKGRTTVVNTVDQKTDIIRENSDLVLTNNGSLEDLRWKIDDALFSLLSIQA